MRALWIAVPLLAACVAADDGSGPPRIEYSTGGGFDGADTTTLFPDGSYTFQSAGGFGGRPETRRGRLPAGAYERARALLETNLARVAARPASGPCAEHAPLASITVAPPIGGLNGVSQCDGGEVDDLIRAIQDTVRR